MFGIQKDGTYKAETIGFSRVTGTGYAVGVGPLRREADILPGEYFGRWTDDDGSVYWDKVQIIEDFNKALFVANYQGEVAIWNLAADEEIRLIP